MSETSTEIHVFLGVFKFGDDPQVVTDLLGIRPTSVIVPGTPMRGGPGERGLPWRYGRWELTSPAGPSASVEEQLLALLPLLEERADAIREANARFEVGIMCAAYFREVNPGFHLDSALLARLAALRLDIDFDLYCMETVEEKGSVSEPAG
ncbi:MAG TPA: DUF4279 domain-containing protein [Gemmatimonadaceae bacterium]|nr:DUF4279 domain-containing protein [Gemmatimonadaceae bacterium]